MIPTKIYPAVIRDFEISKYPSATSAETKRRLQIDVFIDADNPESYLECFVTLKAVCSNREPCAQLYKIFSEAERWGDVLGQKVGVTLSMDGYIQKIVRTSDTITEAELVAKNAERKRIKEQYERTGTDGMTRRERMIALLTTDEN